ncbi:MAG: hypothetical protein JSW44_03020 [Candidatus Bathyarchaeota archaeon]|nr:MAG: hypothetical protein JSW44_03020 [Candidatus Bathyarchaeota archaeon]
MFDKLKFDKLKKILEPEEPEVTIEPKRTEKPKPTKEPSKEAKITKKPAKKAENTDPQSPQMYSSVKQTEKPFVGIKEYSSTMEIANKIDSEIGETQSALGEYLRQLDDRRAIAEKTKKLHDAVAKLTNKKQSKEETNQIEVNGLEIVLDATALNELEAIGSVVKSHQERLNALRQTQEALKTLDQVGDTEGIRYLVLEREGIPERILLKIS